MKPGDQVKTPDGRLARVLRVYRSGSALVRCVQPSNVNRTELFKATHLEVIQ